MSAAEKARARAAGLPAGLSVVDSKPLPLPVAVPTDWNYGQRVDEWIGDAEPDDDDSSDWHIRGIVARDVAQFIAGDPKVGKTMLVEAQAIALASGAGDWCGFPIYGGPKRVLVMPREDSERTTRIRLWQLARGAGLDGPRGLGDWLEIDPTSPLNLGNVEHVKKLRDACARFDVIFIDSFTTAHLGDENSSRDVAAALDPIRDLAITTKTTIAVIHHYNGKGNADDKRGVKHRLRGSSAIAGYARHIIGVSHGPERGQLEIASDGNLEYQVPPTIVELVKGTTDAGKKTLRYQRIGDAIDVAINRLREQVVEVVAEAGEKGVASANAIWKELGGSRPLVLKAVKSLMALVPGTSCSESVPDGVGTSGRLEKRGKRIYLRNLVPGTSRNQSVPGTGTGTPLFREVPSTDSEPRQGGWWDQ